MSAWMVDRVHIDLLVAAALVGPSDHGPIRPDTVWHRPRWLLHGPDERDWQTRTVVPDPSPEAGQAAIGPDELGTMLVATNLDSVQARYAGTRADDLPGPRPPYWLVSEAGEGGYRYRNPRYRLTAAEILEAIACLRYQSCEHDEWHSCEAARMLNALQQATINAMPAVRAAPWHWTPELVGERLAQAGH